MTEFVIYRTGTKEPLTPDFNQAAEKLKANKDVKVLDAFNYANGSTFLIATSEKTVEDVKKALPGWTVKPNQTYWSTDF